MPPKAAREEEVARDRYGFELKLAADDFAAIDELEGPAQGGEMRAKKGGNFFSNLTSLTQGATKAFNSAISHIKPLSGDSPVKDLVRLGVPPEFRARVWWKTSKAERHKSEKPGGYYKALLREHEGVVTEHTTQIDKDLMRTFPGHPTLSAPAGQAVMRRILVAHSFHCPEVGYCQSLDVVAAMLYLTLKDEERSFWMLVVFVQDIFYPACYAADLKGVTLELDVLGKLLGDKLPDLAAHLESLGCNLFILAMPWFMCMFARNIPPETAARVWDALFLEGSKIFFRVALALLKYFEDDLLACDDAGTAWMMLAAATPKLHDRDALMETAFNAVGSLSAGRIAKFRQEVNLVVKALELAKDPRAGQPPTRRAGDAAAKASAKTVAAAPDETPLAAFLAPAPPVPSQNPFEGEEDDGADDESAAPVAPVAPVAPARRLPPTKVAAPPPPAPAPPPRVPAPASDAASDESTSALLARHRAEIGAHLAAAAAKTRAESESVTSDLREQRARLADILAALHALANTQGVAGSTRAGKNDDDDDGGGVGMPAVPAPPVPPPVAPVTRRPPPPAAPPPFPPSPKAVSAAFARTAVPKSAPMAAAPMATPPVASMLPRPAARPMAPPPPPMTHDNDDDDDDGDGDDDGAEEEEPPPPPPPARPPRPAAAAAAPPKPAVQPPPPPAARPDSNPFGDDDDAGFGFGKAAAFGVATGDLPSPDAGDPFAIARPMAKAPSRPAPPKPPPHTAYRNPFEDDDADGASLTPPPPSPAPPPPAPRAAAAAAATSARLAAAAAYAQRSVYVPPPAPVPVPAPVVPAARATAVGLRATAGAAPVMATAATAVARARPTAPAPVVATAAPAGARRPPPKAFYAADEEDDGLL